MSTAVVVVGLESHVASSAFSSCRAAYTAPVVTSTGRATQGVAVVARKCTPTKRNSAELARSSLRILSAHVNQTAIFLILGIFLVPNKRHLSTFPITWPSSRTL